MDANLNFHMMDNLNHSFKQSPEISAGTTLDTNKHESLLQVINRSHIKQKYICKHFGCKMLFSVDELIEHERECKFCPVLIENNQIRSDNQSGKCDHCHRIVRYPNSKHLSVTFFYPSECENFYTKCPNCDTVDVRISAHFKVCPQKPQACTLRSIGCDGLVIMKLNECINVNRHGEIVEKTVWEITELIKKIDRQNFDFDHNIQKQEVEKLKEKISKLAQGIELNRSIYQIPSKGRLVWKIDNACQFLEEKDPRLSQPVYSDEHGYKLCLKAFPNGDGNGKGSHFSLYFVIMEGKYDDLLPWPFKNKVKITLHNNIQSRAKYENYKPHESMESFKKPLSLFNLASGNPRFIELKDLQNNGFIIEGALFIELNIERRKTYL